MTLHLQLSHLRLGYLQMTLFCICLFKMVQNAEPLNHYLEKMINLTSEWVVKFSPSKLKTMIINKNKKGVNFPPLSVNNKNFKEVQSYTDLGISIMKNLIKLE